MTDEKNQEQVPPVKTDESKNTDQKQEEHMIPKSRFDEVNNRAKEAEEKLAALETAKAEQEKKDLEEKGKFKELYEKTESEKKRLELEVVKRDLVQEAITSNKLHPRLSKMVVGSTEEEIRKSLDDAITYHNEVLEGFKQDKTAKDDSGAGNKGGFTPMSREEWTALYEKDPAAADKILAEMTAKRAEFKK